MVVLLKLVEWAIAGNACRFCDENELTMSVLNSPILRCSLVLLLHSLVYIGWYWVQRWWWLDSRHALVERMKVLSLLCFSCPASPHSPSQTHFHNEYQMIPRKREINELQVLWLLPKYRLEAHSEILVY